MRQPKPQATEWLRPESFSEAPPPRSIMDPNHAEIPRPVAAGPGDRRHRSRVHLSMPAALTLADRGRAFGWMKELSEDGALLRCPSFVSPGTSATLSLLPSGSPALEIPAKVINARTRRDCHGVGLGLAFTLVPTGTDEAIRTVIASAKRRVSDPRDACVLIVADASLIYDGLQEQIARLGRHPIVVHTPLDAVLWLQDDATRIDTVLVAAEQPRLDLFAFFAFLNAGFPNVRRVAFAEQPLPHELWAAYLAGRLDAVLACPIDRTELARALGTPPDGIDADMG